MTQAHPDQQRQPPPKKTRWWLILLILGGVTVLSCGLLIGGAMWWFDANKGRLLEEGKQVMQEAEAYAASHDQNECVEEGLRRTDACVGFTCAVGVKIFTSTCIKKAQESAGFCENVPPKTEIIKTSLWVVEECQRRGRMADDQACHRIMQAIPEACHGKTAPADRGE
jgi:hypothetical protein